MALTIGWWTIDVEDAAALAPFYEALLGWRRLFEDPEEGIALVPPGELRWDARALLLYMEHESSPTNVKNRVHPDLRPADQQAAVDRALSLGARRVDIGQGDVSWEVLADPQGNELCILSADESAGPAGPAVGEGVALEAWALDVVDVATSSRFWSQLLGWEIVERADGYTRLRDTDIPDGAALDLVQVPEASRGKNRVHPDLIPSGVEGDEEARPREVSRALALGASRADIGQGDASWEVLADPDGNEFCILAPRGYLAEG
jgi:catechol 2,3-dioxygenase-like lactoylglutathione lyase family enzyme